MKYLIAVLAVFFSVQASAATILLNEHNGGRRIMLSTSEKCKSKENFGKWNGIITDVTRYQEVCWDYSPDKRRIRIDYVTDAFYVGPAKSKQKFHATHTTEDWPVTDFLRVNKVTH